MSLSITLNGMNNSDSDSDFNMIYINMKTLMVWVCVSILIWKLLSINYFLFNSFWLNDTNIIVNVCVWVSVCFMHILSLSTYYLLFEQMELNHKKQILLFYFSQIVFSHFASLINGNFPLEIRFRTSFSSSFVYSLLFLRRIIS